MLFNTDTHTHRFMQKNAKQFFTDAYESASPAYMNMLNAM
jgi:hypothetical protein